MLQSDSYTEIVVMEGLDLDAEPAAALASERDQRARERLDRMFGRSQE